MSTNPPKYTPQEVRMSPFHPYTIILGLFLAGLSVMFIALTAAFTFTRIEQQLPPVWVPPIFLANTLILLGSSFTMIKATQAYKLDHTRHYQQYLLYTVILSLLFLVAQSIGWYQLFTHNIRIDTQVLGSYLYLLSFLHFVHVIVGIPILGIFLFKAYKKMVEPVSVLVYFSDPEKKLRLRLLTTYWHFLDLLWIYLVLFFFINWWLK